MMINNLSIEERKAYRAKIYQPVIDALVRFGYSPTTLNDLLSYDESWFKDATLPLNLDEMLEIYQEGTRNDTQ